MEVHIPPQPLGHLIYIQGSLVDGDIQLSKGLEGEGPAGGSCRKGDIALDRMHLQVGGQQLLMDIATAMRIAL